MFNTTYQCGKADSLWLYNLGTAAWQVLCCSAGAAHVTLRYGSNMNWMGTVQIDRGHGEGTRHNFGTSHCEHDNSTPYSVYSCSIHRYVCLIQTLYPVYSLLWQ